MQISLIAAIANNRIIGVNNRMPWHLPHDIRRFKELSMGKPIIMGRKTFQSIGRTLPGRRNIVVSRTMKEREKEDGDRASSNDYEVYNSLEKALDAVKNCAEVMIIGGEDIYAQTISQADTLYLTIVHHDIAGDTYFPPWNENEWEITAQLSFPADSKHAYPYSFITLQKKSPAPL